MAMAEGGLMPATDNMRRLCVEQGSISHKERRSSGQSLPVVHLFPGKRIEKTAKKTTQKKETPEKTLPMMNITV